MLTNDLVCQYKKKLHDNPRSADYTEFRGKLLGIGVIRMNLWRYLGIASFVLSAVHRADFFISLPARTNIVAYK